MSPQRGSYKWIRNTHGKALLIYSPNPFFPLICTGRRMHKPGPPSIVVSPWVSCRELWHFSGEEKTSKANKTCTKRQRRKRREGCSHEIVFIPVQVRKGNHKKNHVHSHVRPHMLESGRWCLFPELWMIWPKRYKIKRQGEQRRIKIGHFYRFSTRGGGSGVKTRGGLDERGGTINFSSGGFFLLVMDRLLCLCLFAWITRWWTADSHPTHTVLLFQLKNCSLRDRTVLVFISRIAACWMSRSDKLF